MKEGTYKQTIKKVFVNGNRDSHNKSISSEGGGSDGGDVYANH